MPTMLHLELPYQLGKQMLYMYVQMYMYACIDVCPSLMLQEKETALSDDYGKDLASVQALQRRHEGFEVRGTVLVAQCTYVCCVTNLWTHEYTVQYTYI